MKNVLVTGYSGMVGQELLAQLGRKKSINRIVLLEKPVQWIAKGDRPVYDMIIGQNSPKVTVVRRDLNALKYELDPFRVDTVFHLAAISSGDSTGGEVWRTNVEGTRNLLSVLPQGTRVVFSSSSAVYGNSFFQDSFRENDPVAPTSEYGLSKLIGEELINVKTRQGELNGVCLRFCAIVGRNASHGLLRDIVRKLKSDSPTLDLLGDSPGSDKPFIHVNDAAHALVCFAEGNIYKGNFNISPTDGLTVKKVAGAAQDVLGICKPVNWLGSNTIYAGDNSYVRLDSAKAQFIGFNLECKTSKEAVQKAAKELDGVIS